MAFVYKITRSDGLAYIGITKNLKKRIRDHSKSRRFELGIKTVEVLYEGSYNDCDAKEPQYIDLHGTYVHGLNVTKTGKGKNGNTDRFNTLGYKFSEEIRRKMSESIRRAKSKQVAWNKGVKGYHIHTDESRASMSKKLRGEGNGRTRLTEKEVETIIETYLTRPDIDGVGTTMPNGVPMSYNWAFCLSQSSHYNVNAQTIRQIINKRNWTHVWQKYEQPQN